MRNALILLAAIAAFALGSGLAGGETKLSDDAAALVEHQNFLKGDLKRIDKAAKRHVIHANAAARYKSRLAKRVAALAS